MATLILTAVGSAVGGPIGGALGSILGQQLDRSLFAPKARQGSRLSDLAVQTSSYGAPLPKIFGRMRVAGSVIWATDLVERRSSSGGKGQPKTVNYAYSANFAVALSARPILGVLRIWADGKLLRGAAGDFKTATEFRLYPGGEDQNIDPLIASSEGLDETPAFRGLAYAVFENFELADYGNRIPSLTFEIEADEEPPAIGAIAEALGDGAIKAGPSPVLGGYVAGGDSIRGLIENLADIAGLNLTEQGAALRLGRPEGAALEIERRAEQSKRGIVRQAIGTIPVEVGIAYHDPARDFQAGLQRALTGGGGRMEQRALPAALTADAAKAMAEARLATARAARMRVTLRLGWAYADLPPGDIVSVEGEDGIWAIRRSRLGPMSVELELYRLAGASLPTVAADAGQGSGQPDLLHGPTLLRLIDAPIGEPKDDRPLLFVAATGSEDGWRRAALLATFDGGASWADAGATAAPAVMGMTLDALAAGTPTLFDDVHTIEVELAGPATLLQNASEEALIGGANLALIGDELVQFGRATPMDGTRYRLSHLLRGRRGTEWAMGSHEAGEDFTLIEASALAPIDAPSGSTGIEAKVSAVGVGDLAPVVAAAIVRGESLLPPAPVDLWARRLPDDDIVIGWTRRSRLGWNWPSGADTPLGEERERYRLTISNESFEREAEIDAPAFHYSVAMQAADGATGAITLSVRQAGDHGLSRPCVLTLD